MCLFNSLSCGNVGLSMVLTRHLNRPNLISYSRERESLAESSKVSEWKSMHTCDSKPVFGRDQRTEGQAFLRGRAALGRGDISCSEGTGGLPRKMRTVTPKALSQGGCNSASQVPADATWLSDAVFALSVKSAWHPAVLKFRGTLGSCLILCLFPFWPLAQNIAPIPS